MRNHDQKARDMSRSVLPSTARHLSRKRRAQIHRTERARFRQELARLRALDDPDDHEGDLCWQARDRMDDMVRTRREHDKVGPLLRWAQHAAAHDPRIAGASPDEQLRHLRALLPEGVVGWHAAEHLAVVLGAGRFGSARLRHRSMADGRRHDDEVPLREQVLAILAAGCHRLLNDRLRAAIPRHQRVEVRVPAHVVDDPAAPGGRRLVPMQWERRTVERPVRLLLGRHDVDDFLADPAERGLRHHVVHLVYAELVERRAIAPARRRRPEDDGAGRTG